MTMKRRMFLKSTLAGGVLAVAAASRLLKATEVPATMWPKDAFTAKNELEAVKDLYGPDSVITSSAIKINAKGSSQSGDGAVVALEVQANIADVESIAILVAKNPRPLATSVDLTGNATGYYRTQIKMPTTSRVTAYVKARGKLYSASKVIYV